MNWKKALGFGALVWIIMFIVVSIFIAYGAPSGELPSPLNIVLTIISLVTVYIVSRYLALGNYNMALGYGLVFAVVGIVLDFLISQRFAPGMFSSVYYWVSYLLIVFVPLLAVKKVPEQVQQG